jgi:lipoprotein-releasing system ATP-binding protein
MGEQVTDAAAPLLAAEGVRKTYGTRVVTEALKGVDLKLESGSFCALTGPSGCGKTTLLNILGLLDRPTAGRVLLQGRDTGPLDDAGRTTLRAESLGFIFQFHHLLMAFTALENVMMPLLSRHGRPEGWMRDRALELLEQVDLSDRTRYKVTDLSGGQQQRVAVARALIMRPALVLADEPTGNLDTESGDRVFDLLRRVNLDHGTGFLIVTHDDAIATRCDRIVRMVDGVVDSDERRT